MAEGRTSEAGAAREREPPADPPESALVEYQRAESTERENLRRELDEALAERSRALVWMVTVGVGPAALLAIVLAAFVEESAVLAVVFAVLGTLALVAKGHRANKKVRELEAALDDTMDGS